jgi:hypothetical protein
MTPNVVVFTKALSRRLKAAEQRLAVREADYQRLTLLFAQAVAKIPNQADKLAVIRALDATAPQER